MGKESKARHLADGFIIRRSSLRCHPEQLFSTSPLNRRLLGAIDRWLDRLAQPAPIRR